MNEARAIVEAFDESRARGVRCALATVVCVEGSAYRRPGARMLVCEGGRTTGAISAGCLEPDVAAHAERVIKTGRPVLVEYDTASTSDEIAWGLGLGCNGVVCVLVEPLDGDSRYLAALRRSCRQFAHGATTAVATVFRRTPSGAPAESDDASHVASVAAGDAARGEARPAVGARLFVGEAVEIDGEGLAGDLALLVESDARSLAREESSGVRVYESGGAAVSVFIETLAPPVPLVIFGAGQDAVAVVELARGLGWQTEVVDPQARPASRTRFAQADRVTLARPAAAGREVEITPRTLALLMTHNYEHDLALLKLVLASPARYVGVMGPRKRTDRMLAQLAEIDADFRFAESDAARLHAPAGLDIGAGSPAEIAMSIVAEMRAVLAGRRGGMLRERRGSIHGRASDGEGVLTPEAGAHTASSW